MRIGLLVSLTLWAVIVSLVALFGCAQQPKPESVTLESAKAGLQDKTNAKQTFIDFFEPRD